MNEEDRLSSYIDDIDADTTTNTSEVPQKQIEQVEENLIIDSNEQTGTIGPKYIEGSSATEDKGSKQYGLAKPKKTILKAQLKNG